MFAYTKLMQAMAAAGVVSATDPYFNLVTLLLPGNGTNGAQNNTFLDSSSNNFTITRNGNTTQGTFSPFSQTGWSVNFSSSSFTTSTSLFNSGWGTTGASSLTATIDCWIYVNALGTTPTNVWWNPNVFAKGDNYMCLGVNSSGNIFFYHYDGTSRTITSSSTISTNTWVYVAVTISGGTATLYINGTSVGSGTWYGIQSAGLSLTTYLGRSPNASGQYWNGYISNFRVSSVARTISTPTAAFASDGNTSLLTFQSNRFIDTSSNAYALTVEVGTPSVQAFSPFAPTAAYSAATNGGSGYFDGTGDYLTVPSGASVSGSGSFTVEFWVYMPVANTGARIVSGAANQFTVNMSSDGSMAYGKNGVVDVISVAAGTPFLGQWAHVVIGKAAGGTARIWRNGVSVGTATDSQTYTAGTLYVGSTSTPGNYLTGYISGLRITNTDVYGTSNTTITVPTAPPSAVTGSQLLCNFTNAGITDATAKNVLETVGNAQISTTQSKFGGSSMYFDGTGDYLVFPDMQTLAFGTGDFTIEGWMYLANTSGTKALFDQNSASRCLLYVSGTSLIFYANGANQITGGTLSATTWTHFALVRSSGSTKLYVGGTQVGSTYSDSTNYALARTTIGCNAQTLGNDAFNGYLDDYRISKYARYTANFTPPTAAFALQ